MMELEEETKLYNKDFHDPNGYKIRCGYTYNIFRQRNDKGQVFYKIPMHKKLSNGDTLTGYKQVKFANKEKDTDFPDQAVIRPLRLFEDFYMKDQFNPICTVVFTDWEIIKSEEELRKDAINDYAVTIEMDDLPF